MLCQSTERSSTPGTDADSRPHRGALKCATTTHETVITAIIAAYDLCRWPLPVLQPGACSARVSSCILESKAACGRQTLLRSWAPMTWRCRGRCPASTARSAVQTLTQNQSLENLRTESRVTATAAPCSRPAGVRSRTLQPAAAQDYRLGTAHEVPVLRRTVLRRQAGHRLPRVVELVQVLLRVAALPGVEQRPLLVVVQERLRGRCTLSCALGPAGAIVRLEPARQQNHSADRPVPAANSAEGLTNVRPTLAPASEWPDGIAGLGRSAHFSA